MSADATESAKKPKDWSKILRYASGVIGLAAGIWLVLILTGRLLAPAVIDRMANFSGTRITVKSISLNFDGSVHLENPAITPKEQTKYDNTLFKADAVYVRFGLGSLLMLKPKIKKIRVENFVLNALCDTDSGRWNFAAIWFGGTGSGLNAPEIELEKGRLKYGRVIRGGIEPVMEIPLDLTLEKSFSKGGYKFQAVTAAKEYAPRSVFEGLWKKGRITFNGPISSKQSGELEKVWSIDTMTGELNYDKGDYFSLHMLAKDLRFAIGQTGKGAEAANSQLPPGNMGTLSYIGGFFDAYHPAGKVTIEVWANGNLKNLLESKFHGQLSCGDVSVCYSEFPYKFEHITGVIDFTENSYKFNDLQARHDKARFVISGWSENFGEKRRYDFRGISAEVPLNDDVYKALTPREQKIWKDFSPSGNAAVDHHLTRNNPTDRRTTLEVTLLGTQAKCGYFPYPLEKLTGKIVFDGDNVSLCDVVSAAQQGRITINGKVQNCGSDNPTYDINIDCNNVTLGSDLSASLPQRQKCLWQRLNLGGEIDGKIRLHGPGKDDITGGIAEVSVKRGQLRMAAAPGSGQKTLSAKTDAAEAVIKDVSAQATLTADMIHIEQLKGRYGKGSISLKGQLWPAESAKDIRYHLSLFAENIELNELPINILSSELREITGSLNPQGKINISADFDKDSGDERANYKVSAGCMGNSLEMKQLGCDLKNIWGSVQITNDKITLDGVTADTGTKPKLTNLPAISIDGEASVRKAFLGSARVLDFKGDIVLEQCDLGQGGNLTDISGRLKVNGSYNTDIGLYKGKADFAAERIKVAGKLLTKLNAGFDYEPQQKSWTSKNLIADCYSGRLTGQLTLKPTVGDLEYFLQVGFNNVDLQKFLENCSTVQPQDTQADTQAQEPSYSNCTSGKMNGSLNLNGYAGGSIPSIGQCRLAITKMQVGRMSLLAKVLLVLKLSRPEDYAFDQMLIDSYIENKKLNLEKIDVSGKSLAFNGSGWMDLESKNINVTLKARGRRIATNKPSMLQSLTDALGTTVVRIDVTGNFYNPKLEATTLPGFRDSLELLGTKPAK